MQGISISYRRQDSQGAAGRLADHLKEHPHGPVSVSGVIQGNVRTLGYALGGYPRQAVPQASADGTLLLGQYRARPPARRARWAWAGSVRAPS
jgi:hypothetical protein